MNDADDAYPGPPRLQGLTPGKLLGLLAATPHPRPLVPDWELLRIAGQGGSGTVWEAVRAADGRRAAIKIAGGDDPDTLDRIEEEIRILAQLDHPHIVRLLDSGPLPAPSGAEGVFFAMEFIDGPILSQVIPVGGIDPHHAIDLFLQIASGVAHAHEAGILHRDLKPGNVLLDTDGRARVADFGLALPVHQRIHHLALTRTGLVAGTAEYLPPEAYFRGHRPGTANDVFALGVMFHEMLAGTPPRGAWPPLSSFKEVDIRIDDWLARALDPDPTRRWRSVRAMTGELKRILAGPPRYSGTPRVTRAVRMADFSWTLLGLGLALALASSHARLTGSRLDLPLDLIGSHSKLTGGFQALFIGLMMSLPLSCWQIARLWRFRKVDLREALPSPFGLPPGSSRTAAALVATAQLLCLIFPAVGLATLHLAVNSTWLRPDDPPWTLGLAVTQWDSTTLVSPWSFPTTGKSHWLLESFGVPGHPLSRQVEHVSFYPGILPGLMALAGFCLAAALLITAITATLRWHHNGHRIRCLATLAALGLLIAFVASASARASAEAVRARDPGRRDPWASEAHTAPLLAYLEQRMERDPESEIAPLDAGQIALYDNVVDFRKAGTVPRDRIPDLLNRDAAERCRGPRDRIVQETSYNADTRRFKVAHRVVEWIDHESGSRADCVTLELRGSIDPFGHIRILHERHSREALYKARKRHLSVEEARSWLSALRGSVATRPDDLEGLFLANQPRYLAYAPERRSRQLASDLATLQEQPPPSSGEVRILESLPGGRWRIAVPIADRNRDRFWTADLVFSDDCWRCVGIDWSGQTLRNPDS